MRTDCAPTSADCCSLTSARATLGPEETIPIPNDTLTAVELSTVALADGSDVTFGTGGFTVNADGRYLIVANDRWSASGVGYRQLAIYVDAVNVEDVIGPAGAPSSSEAAERLTRTTTEQEATSGVDLIVEYDTAEIGTPGMFNPLTPDRLIIPTDGVYQVTGQVSWESGSGFRGARLQVLPGGSGPAVQIAATSTEASSDATEQDVTTLRMFSANDAIQLSVAQVSGGPLNVLNSTDKSPVLAAARIGSTGSSAVTDHGVSTLQHITAGQRVTLRVRQTSGGPLNVTAADLSIVRVA